MIKVKNNIPKCLLVSLVFILTSLYIYHFHDSVSFQIGLRRVEILTLIDIFLIANIIIERKKLYSFLFKYRWLLYLFLFLFCIINKFNGSSVGMYNSVIQPGKGSSFIESIFGAPRAIRSDEWLVGLPRAMAGSYSNFGSTNNLVRATTASGISATGLQLDYAALYHPANYGFYLFGMVYGESFSWSFNFIFGFAFCFEFFLILTNWKKLLSLFGAVLLWFSPFNLWWSFCSALLPGVAIVVLFYYFIRAEKPHIRLVFGALLAIAGSDYICSLYPAWQVPMGFIILALMLWILITNDNWKHYKLMDWAVFIVDVLFMISIVLRYLYIDMDYIETVGKTVYPGARIDYGGMSITKLFGYFTSELSIFGGIGNPCEAGVIFGAFPLGIILSVIAQFKEKGKNRLLWCLTIPLVLLLWYCTIGMPPIIAKIFLLTNSTRARAVDFLGVLCGILLIVSLGILHDRKKLTVWQSLICVLISTVPACIYSLRILEDSNFRFPVIFLAIITSMGMIVIITDSKNKAYGKNVCILSSACLFGAGMYVHPVMVGLDAITSKPVAKEINELVSENPNAKWIGLDNLYIPNYILACGASTINSVNYIPNYDMWEILDPNKEYEEVWNRYAHVAVNLNDSNKSEYILNQQDAITMSLCLDDLKKLNVEYLCSPKEVDDYWKNYVTEIYNESGIWIYKVN